MLSALATPFKGTLSPARAGGAGLNSASRDWIVEKFHPAAKPRRRREATEESAPTALCLRRSSKQLRLGPQPRQDKRTLVHKVNVQIVAVKEGCSHQWSAAHCQNDNRDFLPTPDDYSRVGIHTDTAPVSQFGVQLRVGRQPE